MSKTKLECFIKQFLIDNPESNIIQITNVVYPVFKYQTHYRCMSKVVAMVYRLFDNAELTQTFKSRVPVFSVTIRT